jgi:hypothetical protein
MGAVFEYNCRIIDIEFFAFRWSGIRIIHLPDSLCSIGSACFASCHSLSAVTFGPNCSLARIAEGAFQYSSIDFFCCPMSVRILARAAFSHCSSLRVFSFEPDSLLASIEADAFKQTSFCSIEFPGSVKSIHGSAFSWTDIESISVLPGESPFVVFDSLLLGGDGTQLVRVFGANDSITLPSDVECIRQCAFAETDCFHHVSFESNSSLRTIESGAFFYSPLQSICIPKTVLVIGSMAFQHCHFLEFLDFEENSCLTVIEDLAFANSGMVSISIPPTVTRVEPLWFQDCSSLRRVIFESVQSLNSWDLDSLPCFLGLDGSRFVMSDDSLTAIWVR